MAVSTTEELIQAKCNIAHPDKAIVERCIAKKSRERNENLKYQIEQIEVKSETSSQTMYWFQGLILPPLWTGHRQVRRTAQAIGDSILSQGGFVIWKWNEWKVDQAATRREKSKWQ